MREKTKHETNTTETSARYDKKMRIFLKDFEKLFRRLFKHLTKLKDTRLAFRYLILLSLDIFYYIYPNNSFFVQCTIELHILFD